MPVMVRRTPAASFLAGLYDKAIDATNQLRYGVPADTIHEAALTRSLPNAPSYLEDPASAERFASSYYGSKKWGPLLPPVFNAFALSDIPETMSGNMDGVVRRKQFGHLGAEEGLKARRQPRKQ